MFRPSSAFCKSLWSRAGCPKNSVALGAGVGLLDGSLRKWRSIKTPRPHPKAPRASHTPWYGEHRQGCAGTTLAARAPPPLLALLMFLHCEESLVGWSPVLRRGFFKKYGSRFKDWRSSAVRVQARQPPHTCHAHAATVANSRGHPPRTSARHPCAEDDKAKVPEPARVVDAGWWQALTPHGVVDPAGTRVCQTLRASTGAPP